MAISELFQGQNQFTPLTPTGLTGPFLAAPEGDSDTKSTKSSKSDGIKGEEMYTMMIKQLMEHGLASDVESFIVLMKEVIDAAYNPITGLYNAMAYQLLLPLLTKVKLEKELFDKAMELLRKSDAMGEIAINTRGQVYVVDALTGLTTKNASLVTKNDRLLTNGEIALMRASDVRAAFNMDFTNTIANGVSSESVTKFILENISKLGSSEEVSGLSNKGELLLGAKLIKEILSGGKDIKENLIKTLDLKRLADLALNYLSSMLPKNMTTYVQVRGAATGKSAFEILSDLVYSTIDTKIDPTMLLKDDSKKKEEDLSKKGVEISPLVAYQTGKGGVSTTIQLNPGLNVSMRVPGKAYNLLLSGDGKAVPNGSLEQIRDSGIGSFTLMGSGIYIGNLMVLSENYNQIYVNTGLTKRAELPTVIDGNGIMHPDYDLLQDYENVLKKIQRLKNPTELDIENIISNSKLAEYYEGVSSNGEIIWNLNKFRPYLLLNVLVNGDTNFFGSVTSPIDPDKLQGWGTNIEKMGLLEESVKAMMTQTLGESVYRKDGDVYSTIAYIPIDNNTAGAMMASGNNPTIYNTQTPQQMDDIRNLERQLRLSNLGSTKASLIQ